jgi:hypothetical protein
MMLQIAAAKLWASTSSSGSPMDRIDGPPGCAHCHAARQIGCTGHFCVAQFHYYG